MLVPHQDLHFPVSHTSEFQELYLHQLRELDSTQGQDCTVWDTAPRVMFLASSPLATYYGAQILEAELQEQRQGGRIFSY